MNLSILLEMFQFGKISKFFDFHPRECPTTKESANQRIENFKDTMADLFLKKFFVALKLSVSSVLYTFQVYILHLQDSMYVEFSSFNMAFGELINLQSIFDLSLITSNALAFGEQQAVGYLVFSFSHMTLVENDFKTKEVSSNLESASKNRNL